MANPSPLTGHERGEQPVREGRPQWLHNTGIILVFEFQSWMLDGVGIPRPQSMRVEF